MNIYWLIVSEEFPHSKCVENCPPYRLRRYIFTIELFTEIEVNVVFFLGVSQIFLENEGFMVNRLFLNIEPCLVAFNFVLNIRRSHVTSSNNVICDLRSSEVFTKYPIFKKYLLIGVIIVLCLKYIGNRTTNTFYDSRIQVNWKCSSIWMSFANPYISRLLLIIQRIKKIYLGIHLNLLQIFCLCAGFGEDLSNR